MSLRSLERVLEFAVVLLVCALITSDAVRADDAVSPVAPLSTVRDLSPGESGWVHRGVVFAFAREEQRENELIIHRTFWIDQKAKVSFTEPKENRTDYFRLERTAENLYLQFDGQEPLEDTIVTPPPEQSKDLYVRLWIAVHIVSR